MSAPLTTFEWMYVATVVVILFLILAGFLAWLWGALVAFGDGRLSSPDRSCDRLATAEWRAHKHTFNRQARERT